MYLTLFSNISWQHPLPAFILLNYLPGLTTSVELEDPPHLITTSGHSNVCSSSAVATPTAGRWQIRSPCGPWRPKIRCLWIVLHRSNNWCGNEEGPDFHHSVSLWGETPPGKHPLNRWWFFVWEIHLTPQNKNLFADLRELRGGSF